MTKPDKIEVSTELAKSLIPILESQIAALDQSMDAIHDERDEKASMLAELKAKLEKKEASLDRNGGPERLRKGEAEKIITNLLESLPQGQGLSMQDVVKRSGVSYTSVFRILNRNKNSRFDNPEGSWRILRK